MRLIVFIVSISKLPPKKGTGYGFDVSNRYKKIQQDKAKMKRMLRIIIGSKCEICRNNEAEAKFFNSYKKLDRLIKSILIQNVAMN